MIAVESYADWKNAVQRMHGKLCAVRVFLSKEGKEYMDVLSTLYNLASCYRTANELLQRVEDRADLDWNTVERLLSSYAEIPLYTLRNIAEKEANRSQGG